MTKKHYLSTNIDVPEDREWTFHPDEKEVIIMPYTTFIVAKQQRVEVNGLIMTIVSLVEIPMQQNLKLREINDF